MAASPTAPEGRSLPQLVSNGVSLSMTPERLGWLVPSDPGQPMEVLREQYARQGYIWLRGLLDRDVVLAFRAHYFSAMAGTGLIAPGSDPAEGLFAGGGADQSRMAAIHLEIVRSPYYASLCLSRPLVAFYEAFFGGPVMLHRRKLLRHFAPGNPHSTGAHYDLVYLRGGTDQLCTSWIPLGDTPVEMGGLCYLEGADAWGRTLEADYNARSGDLSPAERVQAFNRHMTRAWLTHDLRALADQTDRRWLVADYAAGDMVVHSAYMVHASTINADAARRIRLSTDIRYQRVADPVDQRWQNEWAPDDGL